MNNLKRIWIKFISRLRKMSFRTGLIILASCVPFYILSFAQMSLDISYTAKGVLWVIFFGLAKTFQYLGLTIIGVEGIRKLKSWLIKSRRKEIRDFTPD